MGIKYAVKKCRGKTRKMTQDYIKTKDHNTRNGGNRKNDKEVQCAGGRFGPLTDSCQHQQFPGFSVGAVSDIHIYLKENVYNFLTISAPLLLLFTSLT